MATEGTPASTPRPGRKLGHGLGCLVVVIIGLLILVTWGVGQYNSLVSLDQKVLSQWAQVENVYQRRADLVPNLVETVKGAAGFKQQTYTGKWTPNEVIGHLVDSEWVYGSRLRLILCEDNPTILGMDQDLWVARQRHNEREPSELVETFRTMRQIERIIRPSMGLTMMS